MTPKLLLVLSENWTMTSPRDLRALARIAAEAEQPGSTGSCSASTSCSARRPARPG